MTNSVFLLAAALIVFAFGYRFFAKFLTLWVFRLKTQYTTLAEAFPDSVHYAAANRHALFAQRAVSLGSTTAIAGTMLALVWGWIPAFLWIVVGTAVGAGTYGIGSLWLAVRNGGKAPTEAGRALLEKRASIPFVLLLGVLSLAVNAIMALAIAEVLIANPESAIPFWLLAAFALALGALPNRGASSGFLAAVIALVVMLFTIWIFRGTPLSIAGNLQLQTTAESALTLDAKVAWVAAAFVLAWYAVRRPMERLALPYGLLGAAFLGITLLIVFAAILIKHPLLSAPGFHTPKDETGALPWLFITLTSGAVSGWHALADVANARQVPRESDVRYFGYGGALVEGLIALSAIVIGSTAFGSQPSWLHAFDSLEGMRHLGVLLQIYIDGFAAFAHEIGINTAFARSLGALAILSVCVTTMMSGVRAQFRVLEQIPRDSRAPWLDPPRMLGMTVIITAVLAAQSSRSETMWYWPLFGIVNQMVAAAVLALIIRELARNHQPRILVLIPLLFLLVVTTWALILQLILWWSGQQWALLGAGLALAVLAFWAVVEAVLALRRPITGEITTPRN